MVPPSAGGVAGGRGQRLGLRGEVQLSAPATGSPVLLVRGRESDRCWELPGPSHLSARPGCCPSQGCRQVPRWPGRSRALHWADRPFPSVTPRAAASLLSKGSRGSGGSGDSGDSGSWRPVLASRPISDCGVREASFQLRRSSGAGCALVSTTLCHRFVFLSPHLSGTRDCRL